MENQKYPELNEINTESTSSEMKYSETSPMMIGGYKTPITINPQYLLDKLNSGNLIEFLNSLNGTIDFNFRNVNGDTIMHIFMKNIDKIKILPRFKQIYKKLLSKIPIAALNIQNNDGDTILHIAVKKGEHSIATDLINKGVDRNIRNKDGFKIITSSTKRNEPPNIAETIARAAPPIDIEINSNLENSVKDFLTTPQQDPTISESTIGYISAEEPQVITGGNAHFSKISKRHNGGGINSVTSSATINPNAEFSQTSNSTTKLLDTESFVNSILEKKQLGGSKTIMGHRTLNNYDDEDEKSDEENDQTGGKKKGIKTHIQKLLGSQKDQIHKRIEEKIKNLLKEKNGEEPSEQDIKDYKSYIYYLVTKNSPELTGIGHGLERAMEMERQATKEIIDNVDMKKLNEIVESKRKHFEEKASSSSEESSKKRRPMKKKSSEDNLSSTSSVSTDEKPKKKGKKGKKEDSSDSL